MFGPVSSLLCQNPMTPIEKHCGTMVEALGLLQIILSVNPAPSLT